MEPQPVDDRLIIERLEFEGFCGVSETEREAPQPMAVDLALSLDMAPAAATDDLVRTVDYLKVTERVLAIARNQRFHLLETMTERMAQAILSEFPVAEVTLWVRKLKPPVKGVRESTGAKITRQAADDPQGVKPAGWLVRHRPLYAPGRALDLACGRGRHARYLAREGFQVEAWDRDAEALKELRATADSSGLSTITTSLVDLEQTPEIPPASFDLITVFYYLQRDLMPQIARALKPGGILVYETFLIDNHERFNHPRRREFCLNHNELLSLFGDLHVLAYREGALDPQKGPFTAALVAQRPA
ncbi:MAG: dihydroneopterin aldolase [Nitrospirae bacterium]|nr:MAG: dihydroneopterin aldolase [Nitrospirota bacterium]